MSVQYGNLHTYLSSVASSGVSGGFKLDYAFSVSECKLSIRVYQKKGANPREVYRVFNTYGLVSDYDLFYDVQTFISDARARLLREKDLPYQTLATMDAMGLSEDERREAVASIKALDPKEPSWGPRASYGIFPGNGA